MALVAVMIWVFLGFIDFLPGPWELGGLGHIRDYELDDNAPSVREAVEPEPVILDPAPGPWDCFYEPTMNEDWHDDVLCTNGLQSERPILLPGQFVTEDDMRAAGEEYEAMLNG